MTNSDAKWLKIAFVHSKYSKVGGTEKYLYVISRELAKRGAEVDFFASSIETEILPEIKRHLVNTIKKPSTAFLLSFLINSRSAIKKSGFNIVQSSGKTLPADIYRLGGGLHGDYLSRKPDGNNLSPNPFHLIVKTLEKKIFGEKRFKKIISPSKRVKELLINKYNAEEKDIEVIYNPILEDIIPEEKKKNLRLDFRRKHQIKDDDICYLYAAENFRLKGLKELINAYILLPEDIKKRSRVIIAGGGNKNRYISSLREKGIEDRFIFTGTLKEGLKEVLSSGDVFVHPTYYDPFSNVCLEAISYGLPVITTEINGFSEIMENGIHGYTVPDPADSSKISSLMETLSHPGIRMKMSSECILKSEDFNIDIHIDRLLEIYREVFERKCREQRGSA